MQLLYALQQWPEELTEKVRTGNLHNIQKFVTVAGEKEQILSLFASSTHSTVACTLLEQNGLQDKDFLGAGKIDLKGITFGSDSCNGCFGRDRPQDEKEAEVLLLTIREELKTLGIPKFQS